jgi:hypothetical protein
VAGLEVHAERNLFRFQGPGQAGETPGRDRKMTAFRENPGQTDPTGAHLPNEPVGRFRPGGQHPAGNQFRLRAADGGKQAVAQAGIGFPRQGVVDDGPVNAGSFQKSFDFGRPVEAGAAGGESPKTDIGINDHLVFNQALLPILCQQPAGLIKRNFTIAAAGIKR